MTAAPDRSVDPGPRALSAGGVPLVAELGHDFQPAAEGADMGGEGFDLAPFQLAVLDPIRGAGGGGR
ncbi:hypothetical protein [Streptomyces sp. NBC_00435]|uniref:hypothetical protein n=1 Tax=Streptomyces sp. NBC_00435 TaxID=2903649 RepID=UPI002E1F386E